MEFTTLTAHVFKELVNEDRVLPSKGGAYYNGEGKYQRMYDFFKTSNSLRLDKDKAGAVFTSMAVLYEEGHANHFADITSEHFHPYIKILTKWMDYHGVADEECEAFIEWLAEMQEGTSTDEESDSDCSSMMSDGCVSCDNKPCEAMDILMDHIIEWLVKKILHRMTVNQATRASHKRRRIQESDEDEGDEESVTSSSSDSL